jgi:hypothetical protein
VDKSIKLARLWTVLDEIKGSIDNTAVPLGSHLGLEDPELMQALESLSEKIDDHFKKFRLVAEPNRNDYKS